MKKVKFIAILAIALTSVFAFTSCDKNDDINDPGKNEPEVQESFFYVPGSEEQLKYTDATFTLEVDGKTVKVKMSEMTEMKDYSGIKGIKDWQKNVDSAIGNPVMKIYSYSLGEIKEAKFVSAFFTKTAQPDHDIDIMLGNIFLVNGKTYMSGLHVFTSVNDLQGILNTMNESYN